MITRIVRRYLCFPASVLIFVAGCGTNTHPALVPVCGQVFLETKPAHQAVVWLHPVEPSDLGSRRPHGVVDSEGNFEISTYAPKDGAPAGTYRVAIFWREPVKPGDEDGESLIPDRYMDAATSGLPIIEIQHDPVTLPPFRLTKN